MKSSVLAILFFVGTSFAQETVDFGSYLSTRPWRVSQTEIGKCLLGETYYNVLSGKLRLCTGTNQWSDMASFLFQSITDGATNLMTTTTAVSSSQLPLPTATTVGAVKSLTCETGSFLNALGTDGLPVCGAPLSGSGNVTLTSSAGSPSGSCTLGTTWYLDTTAQDAWFCSASGTWKKVLSTIGSGQYTTTGVKGSAPAAPSTGSMTQWFDSAALVPKAIDAGGIVSSMVIGVSARTSGQFLTYIDQSGAQQTAAIAVSNLPASAIIDTYSFSLGVDNASADLVQGDIYPQGRILMFPTACTISEITVAANAGTPEIVISKNHAGTQTALLSGNLATAASGGVACAATGSACMDGTAKSTTISIVTTSSANVVAAGDWIDATAGAVSSGAKRLSVAISCVRN